MFTYNPGSTFSLGHASHRFGCTPTGLLFLFLLLLTACSSQPDPEQIARVEQNFDKIQPGMTESQVIELVGKPLDQGQFTLNSEDEPCTQPPCQIEIWVLPATSEESYTNWPHVAFDPKTNRVIKPFETGIDRYFD